MITFTIFFKFAICRQGNISRRSRKFIRLECFKCLYQGQRQNCCHRERTGTLGHNNFNFSSPGSRDPFHENANTALFHQMNWGYDIKINVICSEIPNAQHSEARFLIIFRTSLSRVKSGIQFGWHFQKFWPKPLCLPKAKTFNQWDYEV